MSSDDSKLSQSPSSVSASSTTASSTKLNPQQMAISELLWVLALAAVVLAIAMPFVRRLPPAEFTVLVIVVSVQSVLATTVIVYLSRRRKQLLEKSGSLLGLGSGSENRDQRRDRVWAWVGVLLCVLMQLMVSFLLSSSLSMNQFSLARRLMHILPMVSSMMGPFLMIVNTVRFLRWGLYSNTIEFYEEGIAQLDKLVPWDRVELRRSEHNPDRLMILYPKMKSSQMVWIDESLIDGMIAFAAAKRDAILSSSTFPAETT